MGDEPLGESAEEQTLRDAGWAKDLYCIKIQRIGAMGIEEEAGRLNLHAVDRILIDRWLHMTMETLGPGDRAEITLTRGAQYPLPDGLVKWQPDDTLVIEIQNAAQQFGVSYHDAISLLVGFGMGYARNEGLLGARVTEPMDPSELFARLAAALLGVDPPQKRGDQA